MTLASPKRSMTSGRACQGGDPVEAGRLEILVDAGLDHAPVADQGDAGQSEALAQRGHLVSDRVGVGGVAGEGLHGDRAAIAIAQQAVHDLRSVGAVVAGVAVRSELAAGALEVAGGEVVEGEGAGLGARRDGARWRAGAWRASPWPRRDRRRRRWGCRGGRRGWSGRRGRARARRAAWSRA